MLELIMCGKWDYEKESKTEMNETNKGTVGEEAPSLGRSWKSMAPLLYALPKIFIFLFLTLRLLHNIIINLYFYLFLVRFFFFWHLYMFLFLPHALLKGGKWSKAEWLIGSQESAAPGTVGS